MKTIAFNETEYKLVYTVFEGASKLRIVILKEENDIPSVSTDVDGCDKITIKENDDIVAQYTGFSSLEGIQIFSDYPVYDRTDKVICIDTVNADVQAQIATLTSQVQSQEEAIAELGDTVETITPYTAEKTGYIGDTEVIFEDVPNGIITAFAENTEGNSIECETKKSGNDVIVSFQPLEYVTTISISIS